MLRPHERLSVPACAYDPPRGVFSPRPAHRPVRRVPLPLSAPLPGLLSVAREGVEEGGLGGSQRSPCPAPSSSCLRSWLPGKVCASVSSDGGRAVGERDVSLPPDDLKNQLTKHSQQGFLFALRSTACHCQSVISELGCHYPFQKESFLSIEIK